MKTVSIVAASLGAALALALALPAKAEDITIGISFDKMESFREGQLRALEAAAKARGVRIVFQNAQEDAQRQASQIESMIAQGAKAIIAIPWDIQAAVNDANAAHAADAAFITMDQAPADLKAVDFHVGATPVPTGRRRASSSPRRPTASPTSCSSCRAACRTTTASAARNASTTSSPCTRTSPSSLRCRPTGSR